jgi:hypothetical protein
MKKLLSSGRILQLCREDIPPLKHKSFLFSYLGYVLNFFLASVPLDSGSDPNACLQHYV